MRTSKPPKKNQPPETELLFAEMLEGLKNEGRIFGFIHAKSDGDMDGEGIDFNVFLIGGLSVAVQIKSSSDKKIAEHLRKHQQIHPLILLVMFVRRVENETDREETKKELEEEFVEKV